ncbi:hypothetical protein C4K03_2444 [Pseudomonas synxantha]|uniref:DUF7740 domain-containing protein n=1 Tax=Pseudomonas synxantha TaxID=47883 RepID=A0A3G7U7P3_9PSED|nr:hypothetical protein C4K03_2444 [Pseudomonas synxantha]
MPHQLNTHRLDIGYALLCLVLAERIHGTDQAVIATAYSVRDKVAPEFRPTLNRIIRCRSPRQWVEAYLRELEI